MMGEGIDGFWIVVLMCCITFLACSVHLISKITNDKSDIIMMYPPRPWTETKSTYLMCLVVYFSQHIYTVVRTPDILEREVWVHGQSGTL